MVCQPGLSPTSLSWPSTVLGERKTLKHSARLLQQAFISHYPRREFLTGVTVPPRGRLAASGDVFIAMTQKVLLEPWPIYNTETNPGTQELRLPGPESTG